MLALKSIFFTFVLLCTLQVRAQSYPKGPPHKGQNVRREWRTLDNREKKDYIRAVKCLNKRTSRHKDTSKWPGTQTRLDDLVLAHILATGEIHFNGQFLPWHRYHLLLQEQFLRQDCNYKGSIPYWDLSRDVPPVTTDFLASPLFDPDLGFGGNGEFIPTPDNYVFFGVDMTPIPLNNPELASGARGNAIVASRLPTIASTRTGGGCIYEGEFEDFRIRLGPNNSTRNNERCLSRDFVPPLATQAPLVAGLENLTNAATYEQVSNFINLPHGVGHGATGGLLGEMFNLFSSTNDPLFFLHHANVDRLWWNWQAQDLETRLKDMTGYAYAFGDEQVSLDFELEMYPIAGNRPIRDFMDIRRLGYDYDNS